MDQDFVRTESPSIQIFLLALELLGEKHPGMIISCKFYPLCSWKVYMKNKQTTSLVFYLVVQFKVQRPGRKK